MNSRLPKFLNVLRVAFLSFRWLFVLGLFGVLYQLVVGPKSLTATVGLGPEAIASVPNPAEPVNSLHATGLKADVKIPLGPTADSELKKVARIATLPWMFAAASAGLVLCEIAQRLMGNLMTGEMFSDRNVRLLRGFAIVLVVGTVLIRLLEQWGRHEFGQYAAAHFAVAGAHVVAAAENIAIGEFQLNLGNADLLVGLMLLLVLWAFKEGAALKRDSELTI